MFSLLFPTLLLAGSSLVFAQNNGSAPGATSMTPECQKAQILAQGIALNIVDQQSELATANQLAAMLKQPNMNMQQYTATKQNLLTFINTGIAIRQMNQQIMGMSPATPGLAKVANAQLEELNLALNLTGQPANDAPIVNTLIQDFTGGIQQNQKNQAAAMQGCGGAMAGGMAGMPGMTE